MMIDEPGSALANEDQEMPTVAAAASASAVAGDPCNDIEMTDVML